MDTLRPLLGWVAAGVVGGTFWQGFADVLQKAAVPTTAEDFGKAAAAVLLTASPLLFQWLASRFFPKPGAERASADELRDVAQQVVAKMLAGHQPSASVDGL